MITISSERLLPRLESPDDVLVLDVRERDEFAQWRIPGAVNVPLSELSSRIGEIPADREVVTVRAAGVRAARAAEVLASEGIEALVLAGGMGAWRRSTTVRRSKLEARRSCRCAAEARAVFPMLSARAMRLPSSTLPWTSRDISKSPKSTAGRSLTSSRLTCTPTT